MLLVCPSITLLPNVGLTPTEADKPQPNVVVHFQAIVHHFCNLQPFFLAAYCYLTDSELGYYVLSFVSNTTLILEPVFHACLFLPVLSSMPMQSFCAFLEWMLFVNANLFH